VPTNTITAFVAAFDAKALNCAELLKSYGWRAGPRQGGTMRRGGTFGEKKE